MDFIIGIVLILVAVMMLMNAKTGSKKMKDFSGGDNYTFVGREKERLQRQNEIRRRHNDNQIEVYRSINEAGAAPYWCITNYGFYVFTLIDAANNKSIRDSWLIPYSDVTDINIIPKSAEGWYGIAQVTYHVDGSIETQDLRMHNSQIGQIVADLAVVTRNYIGKGNR